MHRTLTLLVSLSGWLSPHLATWAQSLQLVSTTIPTVPQGTLDAVAAPNRLYVADFSGGALRIYDTSKPTALKLVGSATGIIRPSKVAANNNKVYVWSRIIGTATQSYLYAFDSTNGTASIIGLATLPTDGVGYMVATSTLMCAAANYTVYVFDSNLRPLSTISTGASNGVALNNNYLYVLTGSDLVTYNLSAPTAPVRLNSVAVGAYNSKFSRGNQLALANGYLYINGHAGIFSVSNPASPTLASTNSLTFNQISGTTAYQLSNTNPTVLTVVDLRVPTAPVVAATAVGFPNDSYANFDTITGVDGLVYAVASNGGVVKTYSYTPGVLATRSSARPAFTLYPNPATDAVTLDLPTPAVAGQRVTLRNACGQLVHEQALPTGSTRATLDLAALPVGFYFVQSGATVQKLLRQ